MIWVYQPLSRPYGWLMNLLGRLMLIICHFKLCWCVLTWSAYLEHAETSQGSSELWAPVPNPGLPQIQMEGWKESPSFLGWLLCLVIHLQGSYNLSLPHHPCSAWPWVCNGPAMYKVQTRIRNVFVITLALSQSSDYLSDGKYTFLSHHPLPLATCRPHLIHMGSWTMLYILMETDLIKAETGETGPITWFIHTKCQSLVCNCLGGLVGDPPGPGASSVLIRVTQKQPEAL